MLKEIRELKSFKLKVKDNLPLHLQKVKKKLLFLKLKLKKNLELEKLPVKLKLFVKLQMLKQKKFSNKILYSFILTPPRSK